MSAAQTWLILGASSAIARAFAREAAARGADVILAGRDTEDLARTAADIVIATGRAATVQPFDAVDFASHAALAEKLAAAQGVLNVALLFGMMPEQIVMDKNPDAALACIARYF